MLDQSTRWFLSGEGIGPGENQAKIIQTKKPLRHYHHHHHHPQIHSAVLFVIVLLLSVLCSSTKASDISSNDIFDDDVELFDADESQNFHQSLEFTQEVYDVVIPENSLGKVYAVPSDLNTKMGIALPKSMLRGYSVRFRIRSGDNDGFFKAESEQIGDFVFLLIRTKTNTLDVLNRERRDFYELEIRTRIRDKNNRRLKTASEAITIVRVTVSDINDNSPMFIEPTYNFVVPEDTPLHTSVGQVYAEDADDGINGEIYYSLIDPKSSFAVDPVTGVIFLTRPLSHHKQPQHEIAIMAQDRGAKSRFATRAPDTAKVQLSVRQVNLHDPSIEVHHLPEVIEQSNADIYAIVRIQDPDEGRHGEVASLEIVEGDPEAHFRIRRPSISEPNEFNIEVLRLLDREISPYGYNLTLKAIDKGYPARSSYKEVHVRLADLNDHAPVFDRETYEVRVNESVPVNTPILRLKATDEDQGSNAKVTISIVAGNRDGHFRINQRTGVLYVHKSLDAETKSAYSLTVTALDHANQGMRKQTSAKVRVYIVDVNDNDPKFKDGFFQEVTFDENKPAGSKVYQVGAYDEDSGENSYISYSIANVNTEEMPFEIDDFSGQIRSVRVLDFESDRRVYHLKVRASDWGTPYRRQSEMRLTIRLQDINDNRPQFERVNCVGELDRDLVNPGATIFTLSALDFDAGNIINYRLVSDNSDGCFSLDTHKGTLSVMCDLRTLPMTTRTLNVTATDGQHFSDVTPLVLNFNRIRDKNKWYLNQNDVNYGVQFKCRDTNVANRLTEMMAMAERNNAVMTADDNFHLTSALPTRFGSNVHPPEIRRLPSEITVPETASLATKLLKVEGFDRDLGFNGDLLYVISDGDYDSVFKLDTISGELFVDGELDRERTSDYLLNITVQDQGSPSPKFASKLLHIIVTDVNDNAPQFLKSTFSFFFPENTPKGTPVVKLNASDPDIGVQGEVTYYLEPTSSSSHFHLDSVSGTLSLAKPLDRESQEFYDMTVKAEDNDPDLPLASYAHVRVRVLDVNDVEPQFSSKTYHIKAREDLPIGTVVGSVQAYDPDLYQGGFVKYSLKHDDHHQFMIDDASGVIRLKKRLNFEAKQLYNLTVKATDEGSPPLTSFASVYIKVLDVNENQHPPRFDRFFVKTAVPENMPINSLVATVTAKDADAVRMVDSEDAKISYSIKGGSGIGDFFIDDKGRIKTLTVLDRELQESFWLSIIAQDHGTAPLASRLDVFIKVLDMNDNVPMTIKPVYHVEVRENSKPWTPIVQLEASDNDASEDQMITFEIISGNPQSLFTLDEISGQISTTIRSLDREAQAEHLLEILVSDQGQPPLNSTTRVIVNVLDENDNKPEFLERFQKVTLLVDEDVRLDTAIKDMQNDDQSILDNDPNGSLTDMDQDMLDDFVSNFEDDSEQQPWESFNDSDLNKAHPLFRPLAYDRDRGSNGKLKYSLKASQPGLFQICPSSGMMYSSRPIYDPEASFEILVKAADSGSKELFSLSRISLDMHPRASSNESSHSPRVLEKSSRIQIFETDPIGHLVTLVHADDKDGDEIFFSITEGDPNHDFYINPNMGNLVVGQPLNSSRNNFYNLTISVTDGNEITKANVIIDVLGVSMSRPQFDSDIIEVEVIENEPEGYLVTKIELRRNTNGEQHKQPSVTYSFQGAQHPGSISLFKIHPTSGEITLRERLDMERMREHVLIVVIKDNLSDLQNWAKLVIHVLDDNDHEPRFLADLIQTRLKADAELGSSVVQVQAYDNDHGLNGELRYSILHGNKDDTFVIDQTLGNVVLAKDLSDVQTEFMLMVKATDQSIDGEKRSATIPVHILLTSGDDLSPKFVKRAFTVEIKENSPKGTLIVHTEANGNSALWYKIQNHPEDMFKINPSTGHIVNQWNLDHETQNFYNFSVEVTNTLGQKDTCSVEVHVLDTNDNRPSFQASSFAGFVSELASIGSLVLESQYYPLVIKANDQDAGINSLLSYEILDAEAKNNFAIDESTGALRTINTLDYELKPKYEFEVRVSDRGSPRLTSDTTTKVIIDLKDENDCPPKFISDQPSEVILLLPTFKGVPVAQVKAYDQDLGLHSNLSYSILSGNEDGLFKINADSGWIHVVQSGAGGKVNHQQYNLDVSVTDGKYNDRKLITINVEDADNAGLAFAKDKYHASVLENSTKSDVLVIVNVLGADINENLRFSILNLDADSRDLFSIGVTSGAIRSTGKPFDREIQDKYSFVIEVRSEAGRGINPRVAHTMLDVTVLDMNDNAPIFVNLPYFAMIQKDESKKDSSVIKVHAIDKDAGQNGDIFYQLLKGNGELFRVGRKSGLITLRTDISSEEFLDEYAITIAAYDGGTPPFSAEVVVVIKIVNENVPVFEQQLYTQSVKEDVEIFTPLLSVKANSPKLDQRTGQPQKVIYSIEAGNEATDMFYIDPDSGMMSNIALLDYEAKRHHQLRVRATDCVNGGYSESIVLFAIEDINDCPPQFEKSHYRVNVSETTPVGQTIMQVTATDADEISQLTYSLIRSNDSELSLFNIDAITGQISLRSYLDRERKSRHQLKILAVDRGQDSSRPHLSSSTMLDVTVTDQNDNAPTFEEAEYDVRLSNRATRGQFVAVVRSFDPDEASDLRYTISEGNEDHTFKIDDQTGIISLANLNSFQNKSMYDLTLSVTDGIFASATRMKIGIISENLHAPIFAQDSYEVDFSEGQPENVQVFKVTAQDLDRDDAITYTIRDDNLLSLFSIDALTGEIWSRIMFDRESKDSYHLQITATDSGGRSGFANLIIRIKDVNDNHPKFELEEYKSNVYANLSKGDHIMQLKAVDLDEGANAEAVFTIYDNDDNHNHLDLFEIESNTGVIKLKKKLQKKHENQIYQFWVRAQDQGSPFQLHSEVPVEIYIMSQLDQAPIFSKRDSVYFIRENTPIGRVITQLEAKVQDADADNDDLEGDSVRYRIVSGDYVDEKLFQVDFKGRVIISGRLDRELKPLHKLTVLAMTQTSPTLNSYFDLSIQVLDVNDNSPEFQSDPYDIQVSEGIELNTNILQVKAIDIDFGNNAEVRYALIELDPYQSYSIDAHSGWIQNLKYLDAESSVLHELVVEAEDGNGLKAKTTVRIHVQDVNDNSHRFSQRHYSAAVNEGALPGTIVFQLMTEDPDRMAKTRVDFYIREGDPDALFGIKSNGEVYVSRHLDRESQAIYKLEVVASDGTFVTEAKVKIEILDDNDNPPECLRTSYQFQISEDTLPGFTMAQIEVSDKDEGINAQQAFILNGPNADFFSLDSDKGMLALALPLDREMISSYVLRAHAQDAGMPEWECVSDIFIKIEDVNDNPPKFSQDVFTASLREDTPIDAIATKIHATDDDGLPMNKKISYDILDGSQEFRIDSETGMVRLAKSLDREVQDMYNLTVRAMDHGRPRLSQIANLIILILDVNDNPPEFASRMYFTHVMEDVAKGTDVLQVLATSKDSGINADITYSIVSGNEGRKFEIHPKTGMITVSASVDHELRPAYFLTIQAQDGGDPPLNNHATVNITVIDCNDNSPMFSQVSYNAMINEAAGKGEDIISVTATDMDSGENGNIMYSIRSGDRNNQFKINKQTGMITVASDLDREMISSYVLEIEAADHGTPVRSSTVLINIDITDANDNPPQFTENNYTVYMQEDKTYGYILARFSVTDADDSPNAGPFTFDIRDGNEDNSFRVVQDGTLRTAAKFNHQVKDKYTLKIRAFDNGSPPLYSDVMVRVNIIEESQFPPIMVPLKVEVKSYLDDFPGALVGRIKASDQDPYDQLNYDIVDGTGLFDIDHSKGTIIALEGLDVGVYTLNISVSDGKFTSFGEAIVTVDLITDEMLDESVILRFQYIEPENFILSYQNGLVKMIKSILNVRTSDVIILSVQSSASSQGRPRMIQRTKRDEKRALPAGAADAPNDLFNETIEPELEVLFVIRRKDEFMSRDKVRNGLKNKLDSISSNLHGLQVLEMQEDECTVNHCQHGKCLDEVQMDETSYVASLNDMISFVGPRHHYQTVCQCEQGFTGRKCGKILNECAKKPCPQHQLCIPTDDLPLGYKCSCPSGMIGQFCNIDVKSCSDNDKCLSNLVNPMTYNGKSFAKFHVIRSIERHMSLTLGFRTTWSSGVIMESKGQVDYIILEVDEGKLKCRFNFGSGQGLVMISSINVDDGHWHYVNLERHGNSAKLIIDNKYDSQGSSNGVNDALDNGDDGVVVFGNNKDLTKGFYGCLDNLRIDDLPLPMDSENNAIAELLELHQVEFKCQAKLDEPGACGSQPCQNGGTCLDLQSHDNENTMDYECQCMDRFKGSHCQEDLDPCAKNPCLNGAKCINLVNDFHCECPTEQLTGKRCHYGLFCNPNPCKNGGVCEEGSEGPICHCRGYTGSSNCTVDINECLRQNPCQYGGTCINTSGSFKCACPPGTKQPYCQAVGSQVPQREGGRNYAFKLEELIMIIASLFGLVLIAFVIAMCKRFRDVKSSRTSITGGRSGNHHRGSYHIQNDFDKDAIQLRNTDKLNNLEQDIYAQRPLIPSPRPPHLQQETSFNYVDTVRSYGSAADELESLPPTRLTSHDYIQSIQKPMAAVAPSVINAPLSSSPLPPPHHHDHYGASALQHDPHHRNLMEYYPSKTKLNIDNAGIVQHRSSPGGGGAGVVMNNGQQRPNSFKPLKVNLPTLPTDSPGLKGAASLNSLPASNADDTPKYFWDSFDLNNGEEAHPDHEKHMTSEVDAIRTDNASFVSGESSAGDRAGRVLPPTSIDPTRDIETLPEDIRIATMPRKPIPDNISNADTEDEPPMGTVFPNKPVSTSFEQLLALNDDINFADEEVEAFSPGAELPNSYDYHLHLNNYLPTYNISENSETEEQTPMLDRRRQIVSPNANSFDVSSEFNASIRALPEDKSYLYGKQQSPPNSSKPPNSSSNGLQDGGDNLCQLEETDDDDDDDAQTPTVENKPTLGLSKITQV